MNRIITVILGLVLLMEGGILNALTAGYCQNMPPGAQNFFLTSPVEHRPGDLRDNHTFESYKGTVPSSRTIVRDGNDQVSRQYIYGNGIDELIRINVYNGGTVTSYYVHTDAMGSVTAITDADGNLIERVTYDVYGVPTFWDAAGNEIPESLIGNNILFQGREYEKELNLYFFRARYFDPIMGRFLQIDPKGYQDSMNLYQGFNMNPHNFADPFGEAVTPGVDPRVVKSAYIQFIQSGDSPDTALRKLEQYGYIDSEKTYKMALVSSTHVEPGAQVMGTAALMMFEWSPAGFAKDVVSMAFGKDLVYGTKLKWYDYGLTLTGVGGKAIDLLKIGKVAKIGENLSDLGDIKAVSKAELAGEFGAGASKEIRKGVVLGQNMPDRVIPAAKKINADWLDVPASSWSWEKNLEFLEENIEKVKKGKGHIYDIGGQRGRYKGPKAIYTQEKGVLINAGLKRVFTGKWITAKNGKKFRLYEWVKE